MSDSLIILDKAGFPMVWVESIRAHVHWYPALKVQFERYMCDEPSHQFDSEWYQGVLALNPRVSPYRIDQASHSEAFLSGVFPSEARMYARYCGPGFELPTLEEWNAAYTELSQADRLDFDELLEQLTLDRVRELASRLDRVSRVVSGDDGRAGQMFMPRGVLEWVQIREPGRDWALRGRPADAFQAGLMAGTTEQLPKHAKAPEEQRVRHYGFRLIRRAS